MKENKDNDKNVVSETTDSEEGSGGMESRRAFVGKIGKGFAALGLSALLTMSQKAESLMCCNTTCSGSCGGSCLNSCEEGCTTECADSCTTECTELCTESCADFCEGETEVEDDPPYTCETECRVICELDG